MQQSENVVLVHKQSVNAPRWIVVMGANTGGPQALAEILPKFPPRFQAAIVVVQQMRPGFTRVLAEQLVQMCSLPVCEPEDGQAVQAGRIFIAPANSKLTLEKLGEGMLPAYNVILEDASSAESARSRVDACMVSAAQVFGQHTIGVLLTGLGTDGREGLRAITTAGGAAIAQDEATSVVHELPSSAIKEGIVGEVLPLWGIADRIIEIVGGSADAVAA